MPDPQTAWREGPTLSVWIYDSPRGAAAGQVRLSRLSQRGAVAMTDAATVTWVRGAHRPRIGRPYVGTPTGSGRDSPLAALLGRLLPADDAEADDLPELARDLAEVGLGEDFLRQVRDALRPDSSALLVLSRWADLDEVQLVIERGGARGDVRLIHAFLDADELSALEALALER